ncbi:hypothetical protein GN958_ATG09258 [Phytophthora infestans]|uniref:Uncharacterized protein n=1 Tax=Phytophthora infestans TaxID=4787 RepID=A0A8S9ULY9_PHYIN|nr:hypothetical protein GN958_ATG09258 [Phytophthora infestans]
MVLTNSVEERSTSGDDSNASYGEEQFESESEHELVGGAVFASYKLDSSSGESYASDAFGGDEDDSGTFATAVIEGEDNEYEDESFEDEREETTEFDKQTEKLKIDLHESDGNQRPVGKNDKLDEVDEVVPSTPAVDKNVDPQVGVWCSKKILELRAASSQPATSRSRLCKSERFVEKIAPVVVENLIHRASSCRVREKHGNSRLRFRQQLKVPTSVMQHAQTQLWMEKSSSTEFIKKLKPEILPTSSRSVAATFCSVKCNDLLGQLATMQLSEIAKKWVAPDSGGLSLGMLDFVHSMAAKQREVSTLNDATHEPEGSMLHRVMLAARLQLEDSIVLRNEADALLGRLPSELSEGVSK